MKTKAPPSVTDDPIAEIHAIRVQLAAKYGNDPHRIGKAIRARAKTRRAQRVKVEKHLVIV